MKPRNEKNRKNNFYNDLGNLLANVEKKLQVFDRKTQELAGLVQLKAHLGMMDAETIWVKRRNDLQQAIDYLQNIQHRPKAAVEQARQEINTGIKDAENALSQLRKKAAKTKNQAEHFVYAAREDAESGLQRINSSYLAIKNKLRH